VARITVVSERELQPDDETLRVGEGYIGRQVAVEVVEQIWSADGAARLDPEFTTQVAGWWLKDKSRLTIRLEDSVRVEVGGTYVAGLVRYEDSWGPLAVTAVAAVADDRVAQADAREGGGGSVARRLASLNAADARAMLDRAPRDAEAERQRDLPPLERFAAVVARGQ
jgi:hypothetical protein